jgi:hypothetical protein
MDGSATQQDAFFVARVASSCKSFKFGKLLSARLPTLSLLSLTRIHLDRLWALICAGRVGLWRTGGSPRGWGAGANGNNSGIDLVSTNPLFGGLDAPDADMQGQRARE